MKAIDWGGRVRENGHTGLYYGYAYLFDQLVRKKILRLILSKVVGKRALDYGCGSGEFLPVLGEKFKVVHGFDTCKEVFSLVSPKYKGKLGKYDFIQLIAVLSSNTDVSALGVLRDVAGRLNDGGRVLILDAVKDGSDVDEEQANRGLLDYKKLFDSVGLEVEGAVGLYSPFCMGQCRSWDTYRRFCESIGFDKLKGLNEARELVGAKAKEIVDVGEDFLQPLETSNIYIWILRRKHE